MSKASLERKDLVMEMNQGRSLGPPHYSTVLLNLSMHACGSVDDCCTADTGCSGLALIVEVSVEPCRLGDYCCQELCSVGLL